MFNSQYYTCEQVDERLLQGYVDDYNTQLSQSLTKEQFLTKLGNMFAKETVIDNTVVNIGYFTCDTAAGTAAKVLTAAGYSLFHGGSIKVKFLNRNTAGSATLNINSQGAKALYYGGKTVSASNSWDNNEIVEIYYDGTSYYANNVEGNFKDGIFDISAYNLTEGQPTKYATLAEALGTNGNNVPPIFRKGGMQIKYISTSDNKYVQYRLMSQTFSTNESNWQGVDYKPIPDSTNMAESGGVYANERVLCTKINSAVGNGYFIDYNHMVDSNDAQSVPPHYTANANFDAVWVSIFNGSTKLNISGVTVTRIRYFSSFDTEEFATTELGRNTTGVIPAGAVLAIIMLRHSDNAQGYDNLVVTQDNSYVQKKEMDAVSLNSARGFFIDYKHVVDGTSHEYVDSSFDTAWYVLQSEKERIKFSGAVVFKINFFSSLIPSPETFISSIYGTDNIVIPPDNTKLLLITLRPADNVDGYGNLAITNESNGIGKSFASRNIYIDYNHLIELNLSHNIIRYVENSSYDTAWIPIPTGSVQMACHNVTGRYRFFDAPIPTEEHFRGFNDSGEIPNGSAFCLFIMAHENNTDGYDNMFVEFNLKDNDVFEDVVTSDPLTPDDITLNSYVYTDGVRSSERYDIYSYNVQSGKNYAFSGFYPVMVNIYMIAYCDSNGDTISLDYMGSMSKDTLYIDEPLTLPEGCAIIKLNVRKDHQSQFNLKEAEIVYYNIGDIKKMVDKISGSYTEKLIKVNKNGSNIYIRTSLSETNDILIQMIQTQNNMTFSKFYVGSKSLTDIELATSTYLVNNIGDMVGAIGVSTFWFLYAQHGWTIPRMNASGHQLDNSDIGSIWKDQNNRRFVIGNISGNYIYLLPEITMNQETGIYSASWNGDQAYPNALTHVSGAVHTSPISGSSSRNDLVIQTSQDRRFIADGIEISKNGEYYCDEFIIKEHILGHNIGKVQTWFPSPIYDGSLIDWDRCFIFKGSSVTCNMVINTQYPFILTNFRGCIPQMPLQVGNFHSYSMIPKVKKEVDGHRIDVPFNSDDGTPTQIRVTRNTTDLYDIENQPERCITYLKDNNNNYLVGMVGGCSLLRGVTEKANRNIYTPIDEVTCTYGGPTSTLNKFYPRTMYGAAFENNIMPNTFIKEFCCYFCWFDPAENEGQQVYWYKDDDGYIVYAHCQTAMEKAPIRLPDFMEGMVVDSVVEKTSGATLLTEQVISRRLYVSYDTTEDSANYVVLKVK